MAGLPDTVEVELWHLARSASLGDAYTTTHRMTYTKAPFVLSGRPTEGRRVVEHRCESCGTRTKFRLWSKKLLNRLMAVFGIGGGLSILGSVGILIAVSGDAAAARANGIDEGVGALGIAAISLGGLGALLLVLLFFLPLAITFRKGITFSPGTPTQPARVQGKGSANVREHGWSLKGEAQMH